MAKAKTASKKRKTAALATGKPESKKGNGAHARQFNPEHKITLLVKENPKRKNSKEAKRFSLYKNNMTVAQAKEAGMDNLNLTRDLALGYIKVGA